MIIPTQHFEAFTYAGNGSSQLIGTGASYAQPSPVYPINQSLRMRGGYFSRNTTEGNRQKWTFRTAFKGATSAGTFLLSVGQSSTFEESLILGGDGTIQLISYTAASGYAIRLISANKFVDPTQFYDLVVAVDTAQATTADRVKMYVNGVQITAFSTANYPAQDYSTYINSALNHTIGKWYNSSATYDITLTETMFVDGQALEPTAFGQVSNMLWTPVQYAGTYGTTGFYLQFNDKNSLTTLGADRSGNGNNWTATGFVLADGAACDYLRDSPTNNFCTMNPLVKTTNNSGSITLSNSNLSVAIGSYANTSVGTFGVSSGQWYWEMTPTAANNGAYIAIGVVASGYNTAAQADTDAKQFIYYGFNGNKLNGSSAAYGATYGVNDTIGIHLNMDAGTMTFYKNNVSQGVAFTNLAGKTVFPSVAYGNTGSLTVVANFGQQPQESGQLYVSAGGYFKYAPPSGAKALSGQNLAASSYSLQDDLLIVKNRTAAATDWVWVDSVRGPAMHLASNTANADTAVVSGALGRVNGGWLVGSDARVNSNGAVYTGYRFKAGGVPVLNSAGTVQALVSANQDAGFSIVSYIGSGTNATVGHGLNSAPSFCIIKNRSSGTPSWRLWHTSFAASEYMYLNASSAKMSGDVWTAVPSSSVLSISGADVGVGSAGARYIAYCWSAIPGYSAFGSYTGNGSTDGTFVNLGFKPRFVMIRRVDAIDSWYVFDTLSSTSNGLNPLNNKIYFNLSGATNSATNETTSTNNIDVVSNGFKTRTVNSDTNGSGSPVYIYAAFAEVPFKYATAR